MLIGEAYAQHDTHYSMFMFNKLARNPAYAGSKETLCLTAHYRNQWQGIDGAPKTFTFSGHTPFFKKRSGVGLTVISDDIGIMNTTYIMGSYAYRIKLNEQSTLSLGIQGQLERGRINWQMADPIDQGDEMIPTSTTGKLNPNVGFGIYFQHEKFYAGASMPRMIKTTVYDDSPIDEVSFDSWQTAYFMAGGILRVSKNVKFQPGILVSLSPKAPFEFDLNASFVFMDKIWIGASYRLQDSFDAIVWFQITEQIKLGAAADLTLSELNQFSPGSFELMVDYCLHRKNVRLNNIRYF